MPVLRMPDDGSLGSTLGGLVGQMGEAFDPYARARAAQIGQSIAQSQFELAKNKAIFDAASNAANTLKSSGAISDPTAAAVEFSRILGGQATPSEVPDYSMTSRKNNAIGAAVTGLAASDSFKGLDSDLQGTVLSTYAQGGDGGAAMQKAQQLQAARNAAKNITTDPALANAPPAVLSATKSSLYGGGGAEALTAGGKAATTAEASAELGATENDPAKIAAAYPALAAAGAFASPSEAGAISSRGGFLAGGNPTTPEAANTQRNLAGTGNVQITSADNPISLGYGTTTRKLAVAQKAAEALVEQAARARGMTDTGSGGVVNMATGDVQMLEPGEKPPDNLDPNSVYVPPKTPNQALIGTTKRTEETATALAKSDEGMYSEAVEGGMHADRAANILDQISAIAPMLQNQSPTGQLGLKIADKIHELTGITVSPQMSTAQVLETLTSQMIPQLKEEFGFQRVAQPEIALGMNALPNLFNSPAAFMATVKFLRGAAETNRQVRDAALEARAGEGGLGNPDNMNKFFQKRQALVNDWNARAPKMTKQTLQPGAGGGGGGGSPPAPPPTSGPSMGIDADGRMWRMQNGQKVYQ